MGVDIETARAVMAQMAKFIHRGDITHEDAAALSVQIAQSLETAVTAASPKRRQAKKNSTAIELVAQVDSGEMQPAQAFTAAMVDAYIARYKARPVLDGKTLGAVKRLLKDIPLGKLINLYQAFMQMEDDWFKTKTHDFETFVQNIQKVQTALETGGEQGREKTWMDIAAAEERKAKGTEIGNAKLLTNGDEPPEAA